MMKTRTAIVAIPGWVCLRVVLSRPATSVCRLRHDRMEQGPTEPHAGRSTFLLSSGGAGGGYTGPVPTENQFPCRTIVARLVLSVPPTGRGGGGDEGKKKFVYRNSACHLWLSVQNVIFPQRNFFGFGCVGGLAWGGGGGVRQITPPPSPCELT